MKTVDSRGVFYALLVLLYGAVFSFTACSNDDDPNDDPNAKRQYVPKFEFTASVTPDLFDVADITVIYQDVNGVRVSEKITSRTWSKSIEGKSLPASAGCIYQFTKKTGFVPTKATYVLGAEVLNKVFVRESTSSDFISVGNISQESITRTVKPEFIDSVLTIMNGTDFAYKVSLNSNNKPVVQEVDI